MTDDFLFIDILLYLVYALLGIVVVVAGWSGVHGMMKNERRKPILAYADMLLVVVLLTATYLFASTRPVVSNGQLFTDVLWLRVSDMFIFTSLFLICLCSVAVMIAKFRR
jgi:hypothetical protein